MTDPQETRPWRRHALVALMALAVFVTVGLAAHLAGQAATGRNTPDSFPWDVPPTVGPGLPPPLTPFAHVDPAIITALEQDQGVYDVDPLAVVGSDVPPVGAFLPLTGRAPLSLTPSRPPPTLAPLPTVSLLEQAADAGIQPTEHALDGPPALAYGGDGCAPRGLPVSGVLTQRFHQWHAGIDLGVPVGTPIVATHSGRVLYAGWSAIGYGNLVILQNGAFITYYAHLSGFNVVVDQQVGAGSVLGFSGNTGNSTGPHLHYETRINDVPVDPLTFENRGYPWC